MPFPLPHAVIVTVYDLTMRTFWLSSRGRKRSGVLFGAEITEIFSYTTNAQWFNKKTTRHQVRPIPHKKKKKLNPAAETAVTNRCGEFVFKTPHGTTIFSLRFHALCDVYCIPMTIYNAIVRFSFLNIHFSGFSL